MLRLLTAQHGLQLALREQYNGRSAENGGVCALKWPAEERTRFVCSGTGGCSTWVTSVAGEKRHRRTHHPSFCRFCHNIEHTAGPKDASQDLLWALRNLEFWSFLGTVIVKLLGPNQGQTSSEGLRDDLASGGQGDESLCHHCTLCSPLGLGLLSPLCSSCPLFSAPQLRPCCTRFLLSSPWDSHTQRATLS